MAIRHLYATATNTSANSSIILPPCAILAFQLSMGVIYANAGNVASQVQLSTINLNQIGLNDAPGILGTLVGGCSAVDIATAGLSEMFYPPNLYFTGPTPVYLWVNTAGGASNTVYGYCTIYTT